jgi:subtilase family serine protease
MTFEIHAAIILTAMISLSKLMPTLLLLSVAMTSVTAAMLPVKAQSNVYPRGPFDFRAAYDVNPLLRAGYTGKGVTVAIVGEAISQTFNSDVNEFSSKYGLPAPIISIVRPFGSGGKNSTWDETTADTEFVHAMAPDARILLVLVGSHDVPDGFSYVIDHNAADIATMSFYWYYDDYGNGWAMSKVQSYNEEYAKSVSEKITLISTSGDYGSNNTVPWSGSGTWTGTFWTHYLPNVYIDIPEYSPYVTIVGGTEFTTVSGPGPEIGWSQSGGGPSRAFSEPSWQTGQGVPQNHWRNTPDIALDASCNTPYAFDYNNDQETWFCGTSAAAPTFAGIIADIDQAAGSRVGFLNPTLYELGASDPSVYHDISSGCSLVEVGSSTSKGYCAHPKWDFVTGWGSIDAAKLAKDLISSAQTITTATSNTSPTSISTLSLISTTSTMTQIRTSESLVSSLPLRSVGGNGSETLILGVAAVSLIVLGIVAILRRRKAIAS